MLAIHWRGVLLGGLFLAAHATTVAAQERELLTLEDALSRSGVTGEVDEISANPRMVGPRAEADAARSLVGQARLRPNPEGHLHSQKHQALQYNPIQDYLYLR